MKRNLTSMKTVESVESVGWSDYGIYYICIYGSPFYLATTQSL